MDKTAREISDPQRVFVTKALAEARLNMYSIKARFEECRKLIEELTSDHGKEMVYKFAGDHLLALPGELKALEEALDAAALGINDMEAKRIREKMPGRTVDEFVELTDARL